jgi:biopolymer transport protein ExbD
MFTRRHAADPELKPTVPVTPMLDMAFQLLSFFLLTFHPDAQFEVEMDLALPQRESGKAADPTLVDPTVASNKELEPQDMTDIPTITAVAAGDAANRGQLSSLSIEHLGNAHPVSSLDDLEKALKGEFKADDFRGAIKVRGDPQLKWSAMLEVMDACHRAGFTRVGFAAPLDTSGG